MSVLEPEAGEVNHRRPIRDVVTIGVREEQQVGRIHHPDPAPPRQDGVGHIEPVDEHPVPVGQPIAVGVFVHGDPVASGNMARRRLGHPVVLRPIILVTAEHPGAGRIRVLAILGHPEAPPGVEAEVRGLGHLGLIQQEVHPKIRRRLHTGHGFGRRHSGSVNKLLRLA